MASQLLNFDFNQLRALHFFLEEASIARAAMSLAITPAAASNTLRRLRDLLDDPLLVRSGQHMVRTPLAESLREPAREFMRAAEAIVIKDSGQFNLKLWKGTFSLMTSDLVYLSFGNRLDVMLKQRVPGLDLVVNNAYSQFTEWMRQNDGLAITPRINQSDEIRFEPLFSDRVVIAMRADHPLAGQEITLDKYCELEHVLVSLRGTPGGIVDNLLEKLQRTRRVVRTFPSHTLAAHVVAQSDYVSVLPERFILGLSEQLNLVARPFPLEVEPINFGIRWHRRHDASPIHIAMRTILKEAIIPLS